MAGQRRHLAVLREAVGVCAALAISVLVVARLMASDRASLLFSDGDSLVTVLITRSLAAGEPQDWAMSSVLFLPEVVAYGALSLLGLPTMATLVLAALANFLALYVALRLVAGVVTPTAVPAALAAFSAFAGLALLDHTASRESLELASLLATTTYYSATVIGTLLTLWMLLRIRERPLFAVPLAALAALSTMTNPIYLAWAVVPFGVLFAVWRPWPIRSRLIGLGALVGGAGLGMLARIPLSPYITISGAEYVQPSQWAESLSYYGDLGAARVAEPAGAIAVLGWAILIALAVATTVVAARRALVPQAALATVAWAVPLIVLVGAIATGSHAARYLQPVVFLPVLALVVLVALAPFPHRLVVPMAAALLSLGAATVLPAVAQGANRQHPSADVACVTEWVDQSGRIGAGQFWDVRAVKAYAVDQRTLVQVTPILDRYDWLVNRNDPRVDEVSFLVSSGESEPFDLPLGLVNAPFESIRCGVYTITDFAVPFGGFDDSAE